jgi:hypothetical protein
MDQAFTWGSSPWCTIRCVQNDFWANGPFGANGAPIFHKHKHCLQMERSEIPHDPRHLGDPSCVSKMIFEHMACSTQTVHLSCFKISIISKWTKLPLEPRHPVVPSSASKTIFEHMVYLAKTMHLSCIDCNTISKEKEVRFHMTHIT